MKFKFIHKISVIREKSLVFLNQFRRPGYKGPSIKYVTPILANFHLFPLSHIPGAPSKSTSHISNPPIFSRPSTKNPDKSPCICQILSQLFAGVFVRGFCQGVFCQEGFVRGGFYPFPLLSEYVCYDRKLNITLNSMFRMYDKKMYKCDVTCSLPPPLSQTVTPSGTPSPSSVTYFMDGS